MEKIQRITKETNIELEFELYGTGESDIDTGIGFFDHMLQSFAKHALIDMKLRCEGDTFVDFHHSVEDVGIVIGEALKKSIYPVQGLERFADVVVVMDECAMSCALDLSNRPFLVYDASLDGKVGEFDVELAEEFFRALSFNAHITMHLSQIRGKNRHHIIEAMFKACAVALRRAVAKNARIGTPSTKGVL